MDKEHLSRLRAMTEGQFLPAVDREALTWALRQIEERAPLPDVAALVAARRLEHATSCMKRRSEEAARRIAHIPGAQADPCECTCGVDGIIAALASQARDLDAARESLEDAREETDRVRSMAIALASMVDEFAPILEMIDGIPKARNIINCARVLLDKEDAMPGTPPTVTPVVGERAGLLVTGAHWGMRAIACSLGEQMRRPDGGFWNSIEGKFTHPDAGEMTVTVQRVEGKTLATQKAEADAERDAAREEAGLASIAARQERDLRASCEAALTERDAEIDWLRARLAEAEGERDAASARVEKAEAALASVAEALDSMRRAMSTAAEDWSASRAGSWLWALLLGWKEAAGEVAAKWRWSAETTERAERLHAALAVPRG